MNVQQNQPMCHRAVRKIAREMAGEFYEIAASDSSPFYKAFPDAPAFINAQWPSFVAAARRTLVQMLAERTTSDVVKEEVLDILLKDRELQTPMLQGLYQHDDAIGLPVGSA
jgi:hypothetical protein